MAWDRKLQPFKSLFLTWRYLVNVVRMPWVYVTYLLPSLRPRSGWTYKRALEIYFLRERQKRNSVNSPSPIPPHLELDTTPGVNGVWLNPNPELIVGEVKKWADALSIKPTRLPGYWIDKVGGSFPAGWKPSGTDRVIYFMHGGGYTHLCARPSDPTANIPKGLMASCPDIKRSFSIDYRLSVGPPFKPEFPFPTALVDAISGYNYLVNTMGYSPSNIIFCGDSAGGNLAYAITRYLAKNPIPSLGVPCGLMLISPWLDMGGDGKPDPNSSYITRLEVDFIQPGVRWDSYNVAAFTGPLGSAASTNEYICPSSPSLPNISFKGFPRTFILSGDAEVLLDQIRVLNERMTKELGEDMVEYYEAPDGIHDFFNMPWFEPHRSKALAVAADWVATL